MAGTPKEFKPGPNPYRVGFNFAPDPQEYAGPLEGAEAERLRTDEAAAAALEAAAKAAANRPYRSEAYPW